MRPGPQKITWIAAFDGGKALVYANQGFDDQPDLKLVFALDPDSPPDRALKTDRPGRVHEIAGPGRSAVEEPDYHRIEKERFMNGVIERLNEAARVQSFDRLVVFAPATALGEVRPLYSHEMKKRLEHEVQVDVVNEPVEALEKRLKAVFATPAAR